MPMADNHHRPAPIPTGDVVSGDPPVPITVWPVPAPNRGETMSNAMGVRLVHNLTHPSDLVVDLTAGPQLARAVIAARRRSHLPVRPSGPAWRDATLIVTGWPPDPPTTPAVLLDRCRAGLLPGGCVAVLLPHGEVILPVDVIVAARTAGLAYLQHIVAADRPPLPGRHLHLDIHTDVLILTRSTTTQGSTTTQAGPADAG
ncbi:hypothetical protein [Mangrovihabitans endophyticus]|nr:hypothetical protein [Mangrovihabitans endophyticus]